jgi:hypothetical protein
MPDDTHATGSHAWPALTLPVRLIRHEQRWRYASSCAAGYGMARLVVWQASTGYIAAVTDLGIGASVTNSAEDIWSALVAEHGEPLVLLEHYLGEDTLDPDGEHFDQIYVRNGLPEWRRIWPTPDNHPQHDEFQRWAVQLHDLGTMPTTLTQGGHADAPAVTE